MKYNTADQYSAQCARAYLEFCIKQGARVEIVKKRANRSLPQNAYLHLLLGAVSLHTGYTLEEVKWLLKSDIYPGLMRYYRNNVTFYRSTADLDTAEMSKLIDRLRTWSEEELGLYLPEANEQAHLDSLSNSLEAWEGRFA